MARGDSFVTNEPCAKENAGYLEGSAADGRRSLVWGRRVWFLSVLATCLGYLGAAPAGLGLEESPNTSRQHAVYNTRGLGSKGLGHGKCHREKTAQR